MRINMSLCLPRDEASIPVVRHICAQALREIAAQPDCIHDIEVAVTEACANVVEHSDDDAEYSVDVTVDDTKCVIRVIDNGRGFDSGPVLDAPADLAAENGRGVRLIRALVDRVQFESKPEAGTAVCLEKQLRFVRPKAVADIAG